MPTAKASTVYRNVDRDTIKILREQLIAKDKQIADLTAAIAKIRTGYTRANHKKERTRFTTDSTKIHDTTPPIQRLTVKEK
jgi:hypothetical protein